MATDVTLSNADKIMTVLIENASTPMSKQGIEQATGLLDVRSAIRHLQTRGYVEDITSTPLPKVEKETNEQYTARCKLHEGRKDKWRITPYGLSNLASKLQVKTTFSSSELANAIDKLELPSETKVRTMNLMYQMLVKPVSLQSFDVKSLARITSATCGILDQITSECGLGAINIHEVYEKLSSLSYVVSYISHILDSLCRTANNVTVERQQEAIDRVKRVNESFKQLKELAGSTNGTFVDPLDIAESSPGFAPIDDTSAPPVVQSAVPVGL